MREKARRRRETKKMFRHRESLVEQFHGQDGEAEVTLKSAAKA